MRRRTGKRVGGFSIAEAVGSIIGNKSDKSTVQPKFVNPIKNYKISLPEKMTPGISKNPAGGQTVTIGNNWTTMVIQTNNGQIEYTTTYSYKINDYKLHNLTLSNPSANETVLRNEDKYAKLLFTENEIILIHSTLDIPRETDPQTIIPTAGIQLVLIDGGDQSRVMRPSDQFDTASPCNKPKCVKSAPPIYLMGGRKSKTRKNRSTKSRRV